MADIYDEKDLKSVKKEEKSAIKESNALYDTAIDNSDAIFQKGIDAYKEYGETQADLQQKQTDFTIKQINQQKEDAKKNYLKEQTAAHADYVKETSQHGVNAEQMAVAGLNNTGYSETSKVRMYNAYQNRVAVAREAYTSAVTSYNNAITQAQLQNSSALAEIAFNSLQQQFQLSLQGFQYKNDLLFAKADAKNSIKSDYYSRRKDIINQINTQNALRLEQSAKGDDYPKIDNQGTTINTKYYNGQIAENVGGFGYMGKDNNGVAYQPKGVYIGGTAYKLKKSGKTAKDLYGAGATNSSGIDISNQNVWEANGKYFIWNGTKNQYEEVPKN